MSTRLDLFILENIIYLDNYLYFAPFGFKNPLKYASEASIDFFELL